MCTAMTLHVFLESRPDYEPAGLDAAVGRLLEASGCRPAAGSTVLVKPNLVAPSNTALSCTTPAVVRAVCRYLAEHRAKAVVGDSPAFGTARIVARAAGLDKALRGTDAKIVNFGDTRQLRLSQGGSVGVSALALDAELIVNLPRFKVHDQMLCTFAVKNLFGAVTGFRKAWAHQVHGERGNRFESMIMDVCLAMPRCVSLVDGVVAMHVSGPAKGEPYALGLLGASASPVALDAALAAVLGLAADASALGREALRRALPGARLEELAFPGLRPEHFDAAAFRLPARLAPVAFQPARFVKGRFRSLCTRLRGG